MLTPIPEVSPTELSAELSAENPPKLLDVREADELEIASLAHDVHIPLAEIPKRFAELDKDADWVVICRSGRRSGQVAAFLIDQGFRRVRNLSGGLLAWSDDVDTSMEKY